MSQIERGKTRPTAETIAGSADRLGVDRGVPGNGVATDVRNRSRRPSRAPRLYRRRIATRRRVELFGAVRARHRRDRLAPSSRFGRSPARPGRACERGEIREAHRPAPGRTRARRRPAVLRRRPGRPALPARRLPLQAVEHRDRGRALRRGARARRALRPAVRPPPRRHPRLALALPPASAGFRGRARGRRARRSSSRRRWTTAGRRERLLPGLARRRADGALDRSRATTRSRRRRSTRSSTTSATSAA